MSSRYFKFLPDVVDLKSRFYIIIVTISHFAAVSILGFVLHYLIVRFSFFRKYSRLLAVFTLSLIVFLIGIDTIIYNLYRMHFNRFSLELLLGKNPGHIFHFHAFQYFIMILFFMMIFIFFWFTSKFFYDSERILKLKYEWSIVLIISLMMVSSHLMHAWAYATHHTEILASSRIYPLYFPLIDNALMGKLGIVSDQKNLVSDLRSSNLNYPKSRLISESRSNPNVIFIIIDAWYFKSLDSITMPNIYNFSKKSEFYSNHFSGSNATRSGMTSLFYSIPSTYWQSILSSQTSPAIMNLMKSKNYEFKIYASADLSNPEFDRTIFQGIDISNNINREGSADQRDIQITNDWIQNSTSFKKPFFGFLFYDALHGICHPKDFRGLFYPEWEYAKYEELTNNTDPTPFLNLYKNSAFFVDSLIGIVLKDMETKGLMDNSIIVITADHGQEFNDNKKNYWGHNGNYSRAQLHVPLIIKKPNNIPTIYTHWTSHYDIMPSLMNDIFKVRNPISDYSIGYHINETSRNKLLYVGSSDDFGIYEYDRMITKIYYSGVFEVTDQHLNPLPMDRLDFLKVNDLILKSNSFYK